MPCFRHLALRLACALTLGPAAPGDAASPRAEWRTGVWADPGHFPIAVWLQDPANAERFKAIGVNLYMGLWEGPTTQQLSRLKAAGMQTIAPQNAVGLADRSGIIVGWLHDDEPDNAQPDGKGGYGAPTPPDDIVRRYEAMKAADPSRPVLLNLGRGVGWDDWRGRKTRTNRPDDYPLYLKGADIASFDIYPMASPELGMRGQMWRVGFGVDRLRQWSRPGTPVWAVIETGNIHGAGGATPEQTRALTWSAIVKGAGGIVYFVHQFAPTFREARVLDDAPMKTAISATNALLRRLAPALNAPMVEGAGAQPARSGAPVAAMRKDHGGSAYLFAVNLSPRPEAADFSFGDPTLEGAAEALDENRTVAVKAGRLTDTLEAYGVRIFKLGVSASGNGVKR